jgi:hypothetical protein
MSGNILTGFLRGFSMHLKIFRSLRSLITLLVIPYCLKGLSRIGFPTPEYFTAILPGGFKILYPASRDVGIRVNLIEIYRDAEYFLVDSYIPKKKNVVVDCGAYVGLYTIMASKLVGNGGLVLSIEPEPNTFKPYMLQCSSI